jgi:hypothetical protein
MSFRFSRDNWLTNDNTARGYAKWLLAPAIIVVAATAYFAKRMQLSKSTPGLPSDDALSIEPIVEPEPIAAPSTPLPQLDATIPSTGEIHVDQPEHSPVESLSPERPAEIVPVSAATASNEFPEPQTPPSPRWHKPVVIPYDPPLSSSVEPDLVAPRQGHTARRTAAALAMVAMTAALIYIAFGAMRSQSATSAADSNILQTSATVQPVADAARSSVDPATLPVTQTAEPPPPAEGVDESNAAPAVPSAAAPSATAEPATPARHHARSHRSARTSRKTRAFLYKPY